MLRKFELERSGDVRLVRIDFIGVSGQVFGSRYEVRGDRVETYFDLDAARTRMRMLDQVPTALEG